MNPFKKEPRPTDLELFTIYDSKTMSYGTPTQAVNKNDLMRNIINMFQDPSQKSNMLFTNAEDYSIFKIGSYSKSTGTIEVCNLEHIANLHDLRALAQPSGIVAT